MTDPRTAEGAAAREVDQGWADRFRLRAAVEHGLEIDAVEGALAEVGAAVADAGVGAEELFGAPDQHAWQVAAARSLAVRAEADAHGPGPLAFALVGTGLMAVVFALLTALEGRWSIALSVANLVGVGLLAATFLAAGAVLSLRRAGRPATSWLAVAATAGLTVTTATVLTGEVGRQVIARLPVVVLALAGLGSIAAIFVLPDHGPRPRRSARSRSAGWWYRRLGGLLRGRYRFPLSRTHDLVAEARSHIAASGATHPSDDLGEPGHHALVLAEASTAPAAAATRTQRVARVAVPLLLVGFTAILVDDYLEGGSWTLLIGPALLALAGISRLLTSRRRR